MVHFRISLLLVLLILVAACSDPGDEVTEPFVWGTTPCKGYTLVSVPSADMNGGDTTMLVDMKGNVVQKWAVTNHPVKLIPGGSIIGTGALRPTKIGSLHEAVDMVQVSWTGKKEWSFSNWDSDGTGKMMSRQHHDFQREGNPVGYFAPGQDFVAKGRTLVLSHKTRNMPKISKTPLLDDPVYEVDFQGKLTGYVWYPSDHIDDMGFDKESLAEIYKNPRTDHDTGEGDWLHLNSVSTLGKNRWYEQDGDERFHPDNLILDSREANFIIIVSRKTGKIVWRVGPEYDKSTPWHDIGQIIGPHHAHMIPPGLPGAGNILVFDNGGEAGYGGPTGFPRHTRAYSRVVEFDPITLKVVWQYGPKDGDDRYFSGFVSSAQRLPNGNTLVTPGDAGEVFEVTRDKKVVWRWISPARKAETNFYSLYRAYRVPQQWLPAGTKAAEGAYPEWGKMSCGE